MGFTLRLSSLHWTAGFKLSESVDRIPEYPIIRGNVNDGNISLDDLERALIQKDDNVVNVCKIDGLKVVYDDG